MKKNKARLLNITGFSNETFELFRYELRMFLLRLNSLYNPLKVRRIRRYSAQNNILLNIGAGPFGEDGWVNIDAFKCKNVSFTYDCRKKIPFKTHTVIAIRCEHVLEHMDKQYEAPFFLAECLRVLKPGGVIRIVVPDIEKYIKAYYENNWKIIGIEHELRAGWAGADILTHIFRQGGEHKFGYDWRALSYLLEQAGFKTVNKMEFCISSSPFLIKDQVNHKPSSLYVEGIK